MATVVGLFHNMNEAEQAINDLKAAGYDPGRIGVVTRSKGETQEVIGDTGAVNVGTEAGIGAVEGAVVGGGLAALIATGVIATLPIVGPVILAGSALGWTALGAGVGAVTGAAAGGLLAGVGVPEEEATYYHNAIGAGGILLTVEAADDSDAANARTILTNAGAESVENRAAAVSTTTAAAPVYSDTTTTTTTPGGPHHVGADTAGGAAIGAVTGAVVGGPVGAVVGGAVGAATGAGTGAAVNAAENRNPTYTDTTYNAEATPGTVGHEMAKPLPDHNQVGGAIEETWGNVKRGVGEAVGSPGLAASGEKDVVQGEEQRAVGDVRNEIGDTQP